jgi:transposase
MSLHRQSREPPFLRLGNIANSRVGLEQRLRRFEDALGRLDSSPGVGRRIAEIGLDMTRFPSAAHLASWAGMCPSNNESAGKRKSGKTRKGNAGFVLPSSKQRTLPAELGTYTSAPTTTG